MSISAAWKRLKPQVTSICYRSAAEMFCLSLTVQKLFEFSILFISHGKAIENNGEGKSFSTIFVSNETPKTLSWAITRRLSYYKHDNRLSSSTCGRGEEN
jgi:hypothetical protein